MKEPRGKWGKELYSSQLYRMFHKVQNGDVEKVVGESRRCSGENRPEGGKGGRRRG